MCANRLLKESLSGSKLPDIQLTFADVFILESLSFEDEDAERFEGKIIRDILRMRGKKPYYFYFRTEKELDELVIKFRQSQCRYLHISCHGSDTALHTTLDAIEYEDVANILSGHLKNRRLFVSACGAGNEKLAKLVSTRNKGMYSFAAPKSDIHFEDAAAVWSAFYSLIFKIDAHKMQSKKIDRALTQLCELFELDFLWAWHDANADCWRSKSLPTALTS